MSASAKKTPPTDVLPRQLAAAGAAVTFVACVAVGVWHADNPAATVLWRALTAMAGVFVVGYVVGLLAQRMLAEDAARSRRELDDELTRHEREAAGAVDGEDVIVVGSPE